jgi:serine/threonine protein kinase
MGNDQGSLRPGDRLGDRYLIEGVLGSGGFGVTYKATHLSTNAKVAVKELIPPSESRSSSASASNGARDVKTRFLQEAEVLRSITHPSVVRVYESFELDNHAYIALEFLSGETLESLIEQSGCWSEEQTLALADTVCDALRSVHNAGLLHRDLKPANIMMVPGRGPVLIDFGSARKSNVDKTRALSQIVTPGFAAPEQYGSKGRVGPFTDIYGLSSMLYTVLTNDIAPAAMERMAFDDFEPLQDRLPDSETCLPRAIDRGLSLEVAKRHASVDEFLTEATTLRGAATPPLVPPDSPIPESPVQEPPRQPLLPHHVWPTKTRSKESKRSLLRFTVLALLVVGIGGIVIGGIVTLLGRGDQVATQTEAELEPSGTTEVEPSGTTEPEPVTTTEPEPVTTTEPEPVTTTNAPTTEAERVADLGLKPRQYTNFSAENFQAEAFESVTVGDLTVGTEELRSSETTYVSGRTYRNDGAIDSGSIARASLMGDRFWASSKWRVFASGFVPIEENGRDAGLLVPITITNGTSRTLCNIRMTLTVANMDTPQKLAVLKNYVVYFPQSEVKVPRGEGYISVVVVPRSAMASYPAYGFSWSVVKDTFNTDFCD